MHEEPGSVQSSSEYLDSLETKIRASFGVLDCCVFQNPKQLDLDLFVFLVIDPRRNRQQVIESIRLDSAKWLRTESGFRVIREVGGFPPSQGNQTRRDQCAQLILEINRKRQQ